MKYIILWNFVVNLFYIELPVDIYATSAKLTFRMGLGLNEESLPSLLDSLNLLTTN